MKAIQAPVGRTKVTTNLHSLTTFGRIIPQKLVSFFFCTLILNLIIIDWFLSLHDDKINKDFGNKLRTYRLFKNNKSLEPYLSMKNDEQRILLPKLRISNHNLEIERGRQRASGKRKNL
jgi:hypothetical protein